MVKYSAEQYSILRYIMSQHRTGHSRVIITAEHRAVQSTADSIEVQRDAVDMMQDSVIKISAISTIVDSTVQDILSSTAHSATVRQCRAAPVDFTHSSQIAAIQQSRINYR
jgi:hypothetical protein